MLVSVPVMLRMGSNPVYIIALFMGILAISLYLLLGNRVIHLRHKPHERRFYLYAGLALLFLVGGILSYLLRTEQHVKPLLYYLFLAISAGSAFRASLDIRTNAQFASLLAIACLIGLSHIWTESMMFPGSLVGIDPWNHQLSTTYYLSMAGKGAEFPALGPTTIGGSYSLMHLYLKAAMAITGSGYGMASLIFAGSAQMIGSIILIGVVGKELLNRRVGAAAAVLLAIANWVLFFGEWVIPNSFGAMLSLAAAWLIVRRNRPAWIKDWVLGAILLALLATAYATHLIAAIWVLGTIACLLIPKIITALRSRTRLVLAVTLVLSLLSLPVWMTQTTMGDAVSLTFFQQGGSFSGVETQPMAAIAPTTIPVTPAALPVAPSQSSHAIAPPPSQEELGTATRELALASLGMLLFLTLALVGVVGMLRKGTTLLVKTWAILGIIVLALGVFPRLTGTSLIEHRWWFFAEVLLAIPLGLVLTRLALSADRLRSTVVCTIVGIALLSTLGLSSNMTNRTLAPALTVRYAFTEGEMQGLEAAESYHPQLLGSDSFYLQLAWGLRHDPSTTEILDNSIIAGDFSNSNADVILLRTSLHTLPFGYGAGTIYRINYDPEALLSGHGYDKVWTNGEATVLVKK